MRKSHDRAFLYTSSVNIALGVLFVLILLMGCSASVPAKVMRQVQAIQKPLRVDNVKVNVGSRRVLDVLAATCTEKDTRIEIVDAVLFRYTAILQRPWTLESLLEAQNRQRVIERFDVAFLVVLDRLYLEIEGKDSFFFQYGGVIRNQYETSLSAVVFDFHSGEQLSRFRAKATGTERLTGYLFFVGTTPVTDYAVVKALGATLCPVRISANVTGHFADRDRFAHRVHAGAVFVL